MMAGLVAFFAIGARNALAQVLGTYKRGVAPMAGKR